MRLLPSLLLIILFIGCQSDKSSSETKKNSEQVTGQANQITETEAENAEDEEAIEIGDLVAGIKEATGMDAEDTFDAASAANVFLDDRTALIRLDSRMGKYNQVIYDTMRASFLEGNPMYQPYIEGREQVIRDGRRGYVYLPLGEVSFADHLVNVVEGEIQENNICNTPDKMLGTAAKDNKECNGAYSMGIGGQVVLRFDDNALVDVEGTDLYVFEKFLEPEPTLLEISANGSDWIEVGEIEGGKAEIDIAPYVNGDEIFYFVRLTDLEKPVNHQVTPGADIDAVASVGSVLRFSIESSLLFDFNSAELKLNDQARSELKSLITAVEEMGDSRVVIEGHTDNVGEDAYNKKLSLDRAGSIETYLLENSSIEKSSIRLAAFAASRPVAKNDTEEGRAQNRRVDILVIPD